MTKSPVDSSGGCPSRESTPEQTTGNPLVTRGTALWSLGFTAFLVWYFHSGAGGPTRLAVTMVPASLVLLLLRDWGEGAFYPRLPARVRATLLTGLVLGAIGAAVYLRWEFDAIRFHRLGAWNAADYAMGALITLLILDFTWRRYRPIFYLNAVLILYSVYGSWVPGLFHHGGLSWRRVTGSLSLEMTTGVFERLPQLGLTLIGAFILLLATLRAFGCVDSILQLSARLARRSPRVLPQAAVLGSFGIAAVSGSGAANAATTGSVTIPLLIRSGFSRVKAAAIETASSLGGQLMPPLMGIAAFLMAELLGVPYFEVVARGFGPAIIYFVGVAFCVYLISCRIPTLTAVDEGPPAVGKKALLHLALYGLVVVGLVVAMGVLRWPAMVAARQVFWMLFGTLILAHTLEIYQTAEGWQRWRTWIQPWKTLVTDFSRLTAELTLLLAALGILTAAFTITGVPDKVGHILMQLGSAHWIWMVLTALAFGYLIGMGLPVTPTYIILALVAVPFLIQAGIEPWTAHFFAFFVAVFGELSPPTSVTAAVTAKIAQASFIKVMFHAMGICLPLFVLMLAVFIRPELVAEPGARQWAAGGVILLGCLGLALVLYPLPGTGWGQWPGRLLIGALSLLILLVADPLISLGTGLSLIAIFVHLGWRHQRNLASNPDVA